MSQPKINSISYTDVILQIAWPDPPEMFTAGQKRTADRLLLFPQCFYTPRLCLDCGEQFITIPRCPRSLHAQPHGFWQTINQDSGLHLPCVYSQGTSWVEKASEKGNTSTWWLWGWALFSWKESAHISCLRDPTDRELMSFWVNQTYGACSVPSIW